MPKPGHSGRESLSGGIWGSTFCGGGSLKRTLRGAQRRVVPCLSFGKSKQLTLFGPIDGDLGRQSHQLLRRELRLILTIDDGSDDIGRQRRKSQKARQVADDIAIGPAGDVWTMKNWQDLDICFATPPNEARSTRCGGQGVTIFFGMAKPVAAPQIGPARAP